MSSVVFSAVSCPILNGKYADLRSCEHFYICDNHKAQRVRCLEGEKFDPVLEFCKPAKEVRWDTTPGPCRRGQLISPSLICVGTGEGVAMVPGVGQNFGLKSLDLHGW